MTVTVESVVETLAFLVQPGQYVHDERTDEWLQVTGVSSRQTYGGSWTVYLDIDIPGVRPGAACRVLDAYAAVKVATA